MLVKKKKINLLSSTPSEKKKGARQNNHIGCEGLLPCVENVFLSRLKAVSKKQTKLGKVDRT